MKTYELKCGSEMLSFSYDEKNVIKVIVPNQIEETDFDAETVVRNAVENPIASPKLTEACKKGDKIAIAVSDKTRLWQKQAIMVKVVLEELDKAGVNKEDITLISARGSHPTQTYKELEAAMGKEVMRNYRVLEHDCMDDENLVYVGTTKRGTEVSINKDAYEADYLILLGGIVYHYLAGFGGGRKSILPGLSSYKTIMQNHAHALGEGLGSGSNPDVVYADMTANNPIADDMLDAALLAKPDFIVNVIANDAGKITHAVAGDLVEAHKAGAQIIDSRDGAEIEELADMAIVSGGGYPKDINFYQSIKPFINGTAAIKKGGVIILAYEARDGIGNPDLENMLYNMDTTEEREKFLRDDYTIGKNVAYSICEFADNYTCILVSSMPEAFVAKTNIKLVRTMKDALEMAYEIKGTRDLRTYIMPYGANTFPKLKK